MSIHKKGAFKKGVYRPIYRQKFKGKKYPVYRSSWELHFFRWCDYNNKVLEWTSEGIVVPYISPLDTKTHRYFVDNSLVLNQQGKYVKYLVEIKPYSQTLKPVMRGRKKQSTFLHEQATYDVNQAKWKAANQWAVAHGYKFLILTENELFSGKSAKR
tara:strand:+ start:557 stop:1027 length:471 start_codon:yes stop_codon:yes gene_type:complete